MDLPNVQVLGVTGRVLKKTGETVYDVQLSDGQKYTAWENELATRAQSLVGKVVNAEVEVSQNGRWTNRNLVNIVESSALFPNPASQTSAAVTVPNGGSGGAPLPPVVDHEAEKESRITKLATLKIAATIVASLFQGAASEGADEAFEMLEARAKELYKLIYGEDAPAAAPTITPEMIAQALAGSGVQVGTEGLKTW
jgi:hypothetical protein